MNIETHPFKRSYVEKINFRYIFTTHTCCGEGISYESVNNDFMGMWYSCSLRGK